MALIFCGFYCAGKTTIGKLFAQELELPFYDTDSMIESKYGKKVADLYLDVGAETFRDFETEQILSLKSEPSILAIGGGSLIREENQRHLKKIGVLIYLKVALFNIYTRILKRGFPVYLNKIHPLEHLHEIACQRFAVYENQCHYMIETENLNEKQVFEKVWEAIALDKFFESLRGVNHTAGQ